MTRAVQDVYADYMASLVEISNLKIAGAFHDVTSDSDTLHLFGATEADPPIYYYRAVKNLSFSYFPPPDKDRLPFDWGCWQKIDVQIPVRKVAPIVFNGTLYLLWTEITTQSQSTFTDGNSQFTGYRHKISLKFSSLRLNGSWTAPQAVDLGGLAVVDDPLYEHTVELPKVTQAPGFASLTEDAQDSVTYDLPKYDHKLLEVDLDVSDLQDISDDTLRAAIMACFSPHYDGVTPHYSPQDSYTLKGFLWDQVYPECCFWWNS